MRGVTESAIADIFAYIKQVQIDEISYLNVYFRSKHFCMCSVQMLFHILSLALNCLLEVE